LPDSVLVIHVHRNGETILPHGDTRLLPGDTVTLLSRDGDLDALDRLWRKLNAPKPEE